MAGHRPTATFAELGIPFPLFEAPTAQASDYVGLASCRLCGNREQHCFELGIPDTVVVSCPSCGAENALAALERANGSCRTCTSEVSFPAELKDKKQLYVCYGCLRAGRIALGKDTELGMVGWEDAFAGITHGVPGLQSKDFELVLISAEESWYGARVGCEHLFELLRTPTYSTWQGDRWLFCCRQPMIYLGGWTGLMNSPHRPADPRAFFESMVEFPEEWRESQWRGVDSGNTSAYVFKCKKCGRFRGHCDSD
jgi:hypothetical protein